MTLNSFIFSKQSQALAVLSTTVAGSLALGFVVPAIAQSTCVRTTEGNIVCGTLVPNPTTLANERFSPVRRVGFQFQLNDCQRQIRVVTCNLLITNEQRDRQLYMFAETPYVGDRKSRAFASGNELIASQVSIGDNARSHREINAPMPQDIGVASTISFSNVPENISVLDRIVLKFELQRPSYNLDHIFDIRFDNVPISEG